MLEDVKLSKKAIIIIISVLLVLLVLYLNISIHFNFGNGSCVSITMDKLPMLFADKVVIRVEEKSYVITDSDLIRDITSETMCATHSDLRCMQTDRWIDVYCKGKLIRSMRWDGLHNAVIVYHHDPGSLHWVFLSDSGEGMVFLSKELTAKLNRITGGN